MDRKIVKLDNEKIHILPYVYFLATKFSAYLGRGNNDPIMSKDYEDIVYLLNYTTNLTEHISKGNKEVQLFLKDQFETIISNSNLQEAMIAHLFHENQLGRLEIIMTTLQRSINQIKERNL